MTQTITKMESKDFIWRFPKEKKTSEEKDIREMNEEEIKRIYQHSHEMLYNESLEKKGRYLVLKIIKKMLLMSKVELFKRYLDDINYNAEMFHNDAMRIYELNKDRMTKEEFEALKTGDVFSGILEEMSDIPFWKVESAFLGLLGEIDSSILTNSFIINFGLWLTREEMKKINCEMAKSEKVYSNILDFLKDKENLSNKVRLHSRKGGLTAKEFHELMHINDTPQYEKMSLIVLEALVNKLLPELIDKTNNQIDVWKKKMEVIEEIAKTKGIELKVKNGSEK